MKNIFYSCSEAVFIHNSEVINIEIQSCQLVGVGHNYLGNIAVSEMKDAEQVGLVQCNLQDLMNTISHSNVVTITGDSRQRKYESKNIFTGFN